MDKFQSPTASWWGGSASQGLPSDWSNINGLQTLGVPATNWAAQQPGQWTFDERKSAGNGMSYDPLGASGVGYEPFSGFTSKMNYAAVNKYLMDAYPELFAFESDTVNPGMGTAGDVSKNPSFGQFAKDPTVYNEIGAAASKYGIPANLLKVMIARESSGDWQANSHATYLASRGERIVGYTGIMESTAKAWGYNFDELIGNRSLQIDAMANGLQRLYKQYGTTHGWDGVISVYYSGQPDQSYTPGDSYQYGTTQQYVAQVKDWWKQEDAWTTANGGRTGQAAVSGMGRIDNQAWAPVNQWDSLVAQASAKYGVPANLIKSVMMVESGGVPNAGSPAGATGLMQVMPGMHGASREQLLDPAFNIDKGVSILKANYDRWGTWEAATHSYLGGTPHSGASDGNNTQQQYWQKINQYWNQLNGGGGVSGGTGQQPVTNINMIWGGVEAPITQEHGPSDFSLNVRPEWYNYSIPLLGTRGHPGIDVGVPRNTQIFTPVSGTVRIVGSGSGYADNQGGPGQIMVELDNGHQIIFGHMAGSAVRVGDRVNAGQVVGTSGTYNGDHLHLEYRIPSTRFGGTQEAVDPREALMGVFSGTLSSPNQAQAGVGRPYTYSDLLKTAATGGNFFYGQPLSSGGSTWNSWLQDALKGRVSYGSPSQGELSGAATSGYRPRANPITTPWE